MKKHCYKIELYVPVTHAEKVKQAMFDAGAGCIGNYNSCCWQTLGIGQFKPLTNSSPFIGKEGEIEKVEEYKIDIICSEESIEKVISALHTSHPYETPAYQYWKVFY